MKTLKYITLVLFVTLGSCSDIIDQYPENNVNTGTFYTTAAEIRTALNGCYNSLQKPVSNEWSLTELRSDNSIMSSPGTTAVSNFDLDYLDRFYPSTSHPGIESYWTNSYYAIKSANLVLNSLGANYNKTSGVIEVAAASKATLTDAERKSFVAEACFIRAMQYYNLVRLYGGVFLIDEPISPVEAKQINRSSVADIYKLIVADLVIASNNGSKTKFAAIPATEVGTANSWAAKALLAKVYLNLNKKTDAITLLNDIILNSGYGLQATYANIFSITNEMNSEIIFAVRFKTGGLSLGNSLPNQFAPINSGSSIIIGSGRSYNSPSRELIDSYAADDLRKAVNIAVYSIGRPDQIYVNKFMSKPALINDAENDWPVIRYADVLLMLSEAQGNTTSSWTQINLIHKRATGATVTPDIANIAVFEKALADERRWEFAFENQRFFDLLRFDTTMTTIKSETTIDNHFAYMYPIYYITYTEPRLSLAQMQANANPNMFLLPIPQYEIDTNSFITIPQNPGY
ncbi:RagB/SusD family nutrient uptake outer membrane protein [Flavobacterium cellulosilyticum]|uniref:RagB/SusD family nutrient uptake outer membrane protein n=1 Tax=Flavobacterium cellulosilyticum TaxID=2541731 RepID=A0A4R5CIY5_9FLAO|nr:RagB/SusD family nutrient uptake outer membrane protein [Flavobacterium cellulosilyticum]TDD98540.1 RagB/SusD family nutrient uptake outer membrane protein [Flavobacterium cellulosilyticum]